MVKGMELSNALRAIRSLTDLPEARRRHLAVLAADTRTDAERARLVFLAREEDRRVRENLEAALKADHAARAAHAQAIAERPSETPQCPSKRVDRTEGTTPEHRPVTVTWGPATKTATAEQVRERRPLMSVNRRYDDQRPKAPATPKPEPKPRPEAQHGSLTLYQKGCRCEMCRASKASANGREREKRVARRAERVAMRSGDSSQ